MSEAAFTAQQESLALFLWQRIEHDLQAPAPLEFTDAPAPGRSDSGTSSSTEDAWSSTFPAAPAGGRKLSNT